MCEIIKWVNVCHPHNCGMSPQFVVFTHVRFSAVADSQACREIELSVYSFDLGADWQAQHCKTNTAFYTTGWCCWSAALWACSSATKCRLVAGLHNVFLASGLMYFFIFVMPPLYQCVCSYLRNHPLGANCASNVVLIIFYLPGWHMDDSVTHRWHAWTEGQLAKHRSVCQLS